MSIRWLLLIVVLAAMVGPSYADDQSECRSSRPDVSMPACTRIIEAPRSSRHARISALLSRASSHLELANAYKALDDVARLLQLDPQSQQGLKLKVEILLQLEEHKEAQAILAGLLKSRPNDHELGALQAALLAIIDETEVERALTALEALAKRAPKSFVVHYYLAATHVLASNHSRGLAAYATAARLAPYSVRPWVGLCVAEAANGAFEAAIAACDRAMKSAPASPTAAATRGLVHELNENYAAAYADYTASLLLLDHRHDSILRKRASMALKLERFDVAIEDLSEVITKVSDDASLFAQRSLSYLAVGRHSEAIADATRVIALDPDGAVGYALRGSGHYRLRDHAAARSDLEQAFRLDPGLDPVPLMLVDALINLGEHRQSMEVLNTALGRSPNDVRFIRLRAYVHHSLKEYDKALLDWDKALWADPADANTWSDRGSTHEAMDNCAKALLDFDKALRIDDKLVNALRGRIRCNIAAERPEAVEADLTRIIEIDPKNIDALVERCRLLVRQSRPAIALKDCEAALQENARDIDAWKLKAVVLYRLGRFPAAREAASRALSIDPSDAWSLDFRADLAIEANDLAAAEADIVSLLRLNDKNASAHEKRARLFMQVEDYHSMLTSLNAALAVEPARGDLLVMRAVARGFVGEHAAAIDDIAKAIELGSALAQALSVRGLLYASLGNASAALIDVEHALRIDADNQPLLITHALLNAECGIYEPALASARRALRIDPTNDEAMMAHVWALFVMGRRSVALKAARTAAFARPDSLTVQEILGFVLGALGEEEESRQVYLGIAKRRAKQLETMKPYPDLEDSYQLALARSGSPEKALPLVRESIKRHPWSPNHVLTLAVALERLGRKEEAIAAYLAAWRMRPCTWIANEALGRLVPAEPP